VFPRWKRPRLLCGDCPFPETGRVRRDLHFMPRLSGHPLPGVSGHLGVAGLSALPAVGFVCTLKVEER